MNVNKQPIVALVPENPKDIPLHQDEIPLPISAFVEHTESLPDEGDRLLRLADALAPPTRDRRPLRMGVVSALALAAGIVAWIRVPAEEPVEPAATVESVPPPPTVAADTVKTEVIAPTQAPIEEAPSPSTLNLDFTSGASPRQLTLVPGVTATLDGTLRIRGTPRHPATWLDGSVVLDVTPGSVDDLTVETDAATIRVLGTKFSVQGVAAGTSVSVVRGKVEVTCKAGLPEPARVVLTGDHARACPAPSATGLLVYARQLRDHGAPADEVLRAADVGLRYPVQQPALHDALRVMRMESLLSVGRKEEARAEAETYLASDATLLRDRVRAIAEEAGGGP